MYFFIGEIKDLVRLKSSKKVKKKSLSAFIQSFYTYLLRFCKVSGLTNWQNQMGDFLGYWKGEGRIVEKQVKYKLVGPN